MEEKPNWEPWKDPKVSPSQRDSAVIHLKLLYSDKLQFSKKVTGNHFNGQKRSVERVQLEAFITRKRRCKKTMLFLSRVLLAEQGKQKQKKKQAVSLLVN